MRKIARHDIRPVDALKQWDESLVWNVDYIRSPWASLVHRHGLPSIVEVLPPYPRIFHFVTVRRSTRNHLYPLHPNFELLCWRLLAALPE